MHRRIALATVACVLALPAGASASGADSGSPARAEAQAGSGISISSVRASRSGRTVTARVRWAAIPKVDPTTGGTYYTVKLVTGSKRARKVVGTYKHRKPRGRSAVVRFRLSPGNARRVRAASQVVATATQQYDGPDADRLYERNHVDVASMVGKRRIAGTCPNVIVPGTDARSCLLPGARLVGADLSKVNLKFADLEAGSLAGADLRSTNLTGANLIGVSLNRARMNEDEQSALTFPDEGKKITDLIDTATRSVDVVIYDFGGPNLVGQREAPGALMRAVQRGVNVRVILNSGGKDCAGVDPPSQSLCAGSPSLDALYATEASLRWASQNPEPGKSAGRFRVQFSSQNYQITHQKSILIDTADADGNPLSAAQMGPTSVVMVSTGNLQAFPVDWGNYLTCKSTSPIYPNPCDDWEVENANYLANPAGSCPGGKASNCDVEWGARDFAIKVTDAELLERIAAVYGADQSCEPWSAGGIYSKLLTSDLPDTWANGTLLKDGSGYPVMPSDQFYGGGPNNGLETSPQGNSRKRQLDLIASARKSLIVYNEEMADPDIVNALVAAAARLPKGQVRVVMATDFTKSGQPSPKKSSTATFFSFLVKNGVSVRLLPNDGRKDASGNPVVYIHAKAIVADGVNAFMGSENFGYSSMNFNRELGLMLTNSTDPSVQPPAPSVLSVGGITAITTAFGKDWLNPLAVDWTYKQPTKAPYTSFPNPPYPQFEGQDKGFGTSNLSCLPPEGGNRFLPALPNRTSPQTGPSN